MNNPTPASSLILFAALFTASWARFGNFEVAGFNIRLPVILFALALGMTFIDLLRSRVDPTSGPRLARWAALIVIIYLAATLVAENHFAALAQWVTVVLGAMVPLSAVILNSRIGGSITRMLTAFIWGGYFACAFGLYQLGAFYAGLPQVVTYTATSGGLGRISAFSYEAAYFGYFVLLVIAASGARAYLTGHRLSVVGIGFLTVVLLLANSRATLLALPVFLVLLFGRLPTRAARLRILIAAIVVAWASVIFALVEPAALAALFQRVQTLFDPNEASSNAPRLALYTAGIEIVRDHWLTGIGPGQLITWLPRYDYIPPVDATSNSVIANNVWIQAAADGGLFLVFAHLGFALTIVRHGYIGSSPPARVLASGWLAVLIIAGMLTSFFYDTTLWVAAAMIAVIAFEGQSTERLSSRSEREGFVDA